MEQKLSQTSMMPLILPGDKPVVKKAAKYKVNDIVVFNKSGRLIAHRIIYILPSGKYFITKGDNKLKADGKIKKSQILGKVEVIERNGQIIRLSHFYLSQSSVYLEQLKKINKAFVNNNISYIILKGLPLHIHFNHAPPQRIYFDADLLIERRDLRKTTKILNKLGYKKIRPILFGRKIRSPLQISFIKKTKPFHTTIDLHLEPSIGFVKLGKLNQLLPSIKPFQKHLFNNTNLISVNKTKLPILETETLIVSLLLHLFHHNFQGAHRIHFINSLIVNQKIDWSIIAKITYKFKLENLVYPGLLTLKRYYQTPIPCGKISPTFGQKLISCTIIKLVSSFSSARKTQEGIKRFVFLVLLSPAPLLQKSRILRHGDTRIYFLATIKSFFSRS